MTKQLHLLVKRSVSLDGHRTSVALEQLFWDEIDRLAKAKKLSVSGLISQVDRSRHSEQSLASALRLKVLLALKEASAN
ncbi:MAG: ribbon-helix-helix domain-containing protein [Pseudomonadota bacterium]